METVSARRSAISDSTSLDADVKEQILISYDQTTDTLQWYINGNPNSSITANLTGQGVNLSIMGYNGSASAGPDGNFDDYRLYDFARPAADILSDFTVQATGIGCFFDDSMHKVIGLEGRGYQDLYHFTVGGAVNDPRLKTAPAYGHLPLMDARDRRTIGEPGRAKRESRNTNDDVSESPGARRVS